MVDLCLGCNTVDHVGTGGSHEIVVCDARNACGYSRGDPWALLQNLFRRTKLHRVDKSCQDLTPCESISDSRYSAKIGGCGGRVSVMMDVLWPEPFLSLIRATGASRDV